MNPTFEALREQESGDARIVVLDVTDKQSLAASTAEADRLGIRSFFDANKSKTGTVAVLRGDTRETVTVITGETDVAVYQAALAEARNSS